MKFRYMLILFCLVLSYNTLTAQVSGCTDPLATNFNPSATQNDGSCMYNTASISPTASFNLPAEVAETSGLIVWNSTILTLNDSYDIKLYALDTLNGNIIHDYTINGVINSDWEEISQDNDYMYIGDFGNNATGNRQDLRILRIDKNSLLNSVPLIETINFSYADQTDFTPAGFNNTDFDCEAFVVTDDSIFLFTKQWISQKTSLYSFPKVPGTYKARLNSIFDVGGLITGATFLPSGNLIALSGYNTSLQPFIYLLYDFKSTDFCGGNKRKFSVSLPFHQVGGIASPDGLKYYISNEYFSQSSFITTPQKLHILDLTSYLSGYLNTLVTLPEGSKAENGILFPNPVNDFATIKMDKTQLPAVFFIVNTSGHLVLKGNLTQENQRIDISDLSSGLYILKIGEEKMYTFKVIKR